MCARGCARGARGCGRDACTLCCVCAGALGRITVCSFCFKPHSLLCLALFAGGLPSLFSRMLQAGMHRRRTYGHPGRPEAHTLYPLSRLSSAGRFHELCLTKSSRILTELFNLKFKGLRKLRFAWSDFREAFTHHAPIAPGRPLASRTWSVPVAHGVGGRCRTDEERVGRCA